MNCWLPIALALTVAQNPAAAETNPKLAVWTDVLGSNGYKPSAQGAIDYLRAFQTSQRKIHGLVRQLGSKDFRNRVAAHRKLIRQPIFARSAVRNSKRSPDAEVRYRSRQIKGRFKSTPDDTLLLAAFEVIAITKPRGAVQLVLETLPLVEGQGPQRIASTTLRSIASKNDTARLWRALRSAHSQVRVAAIVALEKLIDPQQIAKFFPLLRATDERVRLEVSRIIAAKGGRQCLPVLVELLSSHDKSIRANSSILLRDLTGHDFGWRPDNPQQQQSAVGMWREWLKTNGDTATIRTLTHCRSTNTNGMIAHWTMDDPRAPTRELWSRCAPVVHGRLQVSRSPLGNALSFDHSNARVEIAGPTGFATSPVFSVSAFVKVPKTAKEEYENVVALRSPKHAGQMSFAIYIHRNKRSKRATACFSFVTFGGQSVFVRSKIDLAGTGWRHLAATCDGEVSRLYVDGRPAVVVRGKVPNTGGRQVLSIGAHALDRGAFRFRGEIDEVSIFHRVLTHTEVAAIRKMLP